MSKMIKLIVAMIMMTSVVFAEEIADKESQAIVSGKQWLSLCDEAKYSESWKQAATFFKNAVKKEQWEQMAVAVRAPLGNVEKRDVKSQKYETREI